jgi:hypothetical protein
MAPFILGTFRHVMTAAGPLIAVRAGLDPADIETIAGALLTLAGFAWSMMDKRGRR